MDFNAKKYCFYYGCYENTYEVAWELLVVVPGGDNGSLSGVGAEAGLDEAAAFWPVGHLDIFHREVGNHVA